MPPPNHAPGEAEGALGGDEGPHPAGRPSRRDEHRRPWPAAGYPPVLCDPAADAAAPAAGAGRGNPREWVLNQVEPVCFRRVAAVRARPPKPRLPLQASIATRPTPRGANRQRVATRALPAGPAGEA
jgi:hypothetical protein